MTPTEFDALGCSGNMFVMHKGKRKYVASMDFHERLFGLLDQKPSIGNFDPWEIRWVRCENVNDIEFRKVDA